jgi:hypothetical protein
MTGILGLPLLQCRSETMNFTKLFFPAAMAGALLISPSAHAQAPTNEGQALIDAWAADMKGIIDTGHGEARRKALSARTTRLSGDIQKLACRINDNSFYEKHLDRKAKELSLIVARKLDCGSDSKFVDSSISLSDANSTLTADDAAYNAATESNNTILNYLSGWGHEAQMALAIKDSTARNQRLDQVENSWKGNIEKLTCHPKVKFDFKQAAMNEKDKRALPVTQLFAAGECQGDKWRVNLHLGPIANNPGDFERSNWTLVTKDMFPDAKSFTSDTQKQAYAAKFGAGGEYIGRLNKISCSDADRTADSVRNEFKNKAAPLKTLFSFSDPSLTCTNGHLNAAVRVEALKSDPRVKQPDPKAKK